MTGKDTLDLVTGTSPGINRTSPKPRGKAKLQLGMQSDEEKKREK